MTYNSNLHISVLLKETIDSLNINPSGIYVDATLGRGGHAAEILSRLNSNGLLICIDLDDEAIAYCKIKFKNDKRVILKNDNFSNIKKILNDLKINQVDGIVIDLGVSSPQLDNHQRGFSYMNDGPLDMRMDQKQSLTAWEVVNEFPFNELSKIFKFYGEIKNPLRVVNSIVENRKSKSIDTTFELKAIIRNSLSFKELNTKNKHPEKVYFQAIRIATNSELDSIKKFLEDSRNLIKKKGRLAIISFHSIEDRIIKKTFMNLSENKLPKEIPLNEVWSEFSLINFKPIQASANEISNNKRAISAKLRTIVKN